MCGLLACLALLSFIGLIVLPVTGNTFWTVVLALCILVVILVVSTSQY